ncbi:methylmalonyl Co-A mutase-associated GTPase MeaB [Sneathiella marina]|uniref:Methylmalonyl Co-A mutase-associated GTPase MeaB n=1 Tax=Sneathiella marina TaxID=2950108 RepID=A0ABY4W849_9PROT|nr:methylmalonyl Co-A mutase-associated GTPase MeaB [Sneathiella marina]USG62102.1 methylmalonyl Co-A mutase-associated GTPase MeaB [Sneathiella marina]
MGQTIKQIAEKLKTGDRRALARAITLVESSRRDHREQARDLISQILPATGRSVRIGISGTPGVGKSTFIEIFGKFLTAAGHKVAVLTIDPSSKRTGGSILGDKTRMEELVRDPNAFIRPSPSGGSLGGVARRTREAMLLCEASGFDVILIETVGVGQSETTVADMVDVFLLLLAPAGGDELQGIKRGVMELADLVVINKADGDLKATARRAAAEYKGALGLMRPKSPHWRPEVLMISALKKRGIDDLWETIERYRTARATDGELEAQRRDQAASWMWSELDDSLMARFKEHDAVARRLRDLEGEVKSGKIDPTDAAEQLLALFLAK